MLGHAVKMKRQKKLRPGKHKKSSQVREPAATYHASRRRQMSNGLLPGFELNDVVMPQSDVMQSVEAVFAGMVLRVKMSFSPLPRDVCRIPMQGRMGLSSSNMNVDYKSSILSPTTGR